MSSALKDINTTRTSRATKNAANASTSRAPSEIAKINFRCFRAGVQPIWEDPANSCGGSAMWRISKKHTSTKIMVAVMSAIMHSQLSDAVAVNGVVVSTRPRWGHLLSIWCSRTPSATMQAEITKVLKALGPQFVCSQSQAEFTSGKGLGASTRESPSDSDELSDAPTPDISRTQNGTARSFAEARLSATATAEPEHCGLPRPFVVTVISARARPTATARITYHVQRSLRCSLASIF
jgi:hypothetical protein